MDSHRSISPSIPAPYGQACANCAQSKCKCFIRRTGGPCERCHRLKKECRSIAAVRRRSPRKPAVSRTARLEEKLDSLVSLMKAGAQSNIVITPAATPAIENSSYDTVQTVPVLTPASSDDSTTSPQNYPLHIGLHETKNKLSPVEAEEYLQRFQMDYSKYFPFIYIPSTTSAQQLQHERPFLWLCIMAVTSRSTSQQQIFGSEIRQTISREMVVESSRNLELLLGILLFITWSHYQVNSKPFLSVFTQLAASLVYDLGFNKPIPKEVQFMPCLKEKFLKPATPRIMEERRAVLGCFLISSIISSFIQKIDTLRWTPHMDECLTTLDEAKECHNDAILVQIVRLQLLAEKNAARMLYKGGMESAEQIIEASLLHSQIRDIKLQLLSEPESSGTVRWITWIPAQIRGLSIPLSLAAITDFILTSLFSLLD